jgi:hypothetical protein
MPYSAALKTLMADDEAKVLSYKTIDSLSSGVCFPVETDSVLEMGFFKIEVR